MSYKLDSSDNFETSVDSLDFNKEVEYFKTQFFTGKTKNTLFKKTQKNDCAKFICENIDINVLIEKAVYILPQSNIIIIDYPIFKHFANNDVYDKIIDHVMNLFDYAIKYYNVFEINLNLESFTVSAAERYNPAIRQFCTRCLTNGTIYTRCMDKFRILNTPSVMDMIITIVKPFVEKDVINKLTFLNKAETAEYLASTTK